MHLCPNSFVNGCEIGLKGLLGIALLIGSETTYIYIYIYIYITADNSANSYSTESHQQKQGSSYNDDAMSLKNEDNNITLTPDPMKRLTNITDNRVLRKRKRKTYAEATQSDLLEGKVAGTSPNVGKVGAKIGKISADLEAIKKTLLNTEASKFSKVSNTPPDVCVDTSLSDNSSNFVSGTTESEPVMLSTQDMEVLEILEELESNTNDNFTGCEHKYNTDDSRMKGYFCSDTVFNLSNKVLTEEEIKVLQKGLDFAPIQRKLNEPELRQDFENFCRRMRINRHFRNEPSDNFSERPAFSPKSSWKPPLGHPNLEVFLSQVEKELFEITKEPTRYSNLSQEDWRAIRTLADDRSIVI